MLARRAFMSRARLTKHPLKEGLETVLDMMYALAPAAVQLVARREIGGELSNCGADYFLGRSLMMLLRRRTGGVRLPRSCLCRVWSMFERV